MDEEGEMLSPGVFTSEFPTLKDTIYLDNAASPPIPYSCIISFASAVQSTLFANPHSHSPASSATTLQIDQVRTRVLGELFGIADLDLWDVIWTSGATAAMKLVGECFPWDGGRTRYSYLKESHTSLVGIRGYALAKGAVVESFDSPEGTSSFDGLTLWAYPAQCNVTGSRLGLDLARALKSRNHETVVLVDAAAYLSTATFKLCDVPFAEAPDFIACSFYKIYGHPTGLGALIVKRQCARFLSSQPYFGGGGIAALATSSPFWAHPSTSTTHAAHEHGTVPFLSIVALSHAMDTHIRLFGSYDKISRHVSSLTSLALERMSTLKHHNGQKLVTFHNSHASSATRGPIISFTLLDPDGTPIGHSHLGNLATLAGLQIRTGGLCNTGVIARLFSVTDNDLLRLYETGRVCGDSRDFFIDLDDKKKPLGVSRISFGPTTRENDVLRFVTFLEQYFLITREAQVLSSVTEIRTANQIYLQDLVRYPIKSCGGETIASCQVTPTGLLYDREFAVVNAFTGMTMSQKQFPRMALIKPTIADSLPLNMHVRAPGMKEDLVIPLKAEEDLREHCQDARVCGDTVQVTVYPKSTKWFSDFLGTPCHLIRHSTATLSRNTHFLGVNAVPAPILLSNESPFTLIAQSAVDEVNQLILSDSTINTDGFPPDAANIKSSNAQMVHSSCFRANITVSSGISNGNIDVDLYSSTATHLLKIGTCVFQVIAPCRRCLMICVDQRTGEKQKEPFSTLAKHRRGCSGRVEFGKHLIWRKDLSTAERHGMTAHYIIRQGDFYCDIVEI